MVSAVSLVVRTTVGRRRQRIGHGVTVKPNENPNQTKGKQNEHQTIYRILANPSTRCYCTRDAMNAPHR